MTNEAWSIPANSVQQSTAVGGKLSLVGESLVFLPHGFEKALDSLVGSAFQPLLSVLGRDVPSEAREVRLADVASVEKLEGEWSFANLKSGGLRDRLLIKKKDGGEEIFVVGDLDEAIAYISQRLAR